jgi:hypothetical protein
LTSLNLSVVITELPRVAPEIDSILLLASDLTVSDIISLYSLPDHINIYIVVSNTDLDLVNLSTNLLFHIPDISDNVIGDNINHLVSLILIITIYNL